MTNLPPGQVLAKNVWPVLSASRDPDIDLKSYKLRIFGEVEKEMSFSWDDLAKIPRIKEVFDYHCVTRWSRVGTNGRASR